MGANQSQSTADFEPPSTNHTATLYYFAGRGLADQIRWMLAATNVDFCQKVVSSREKFLELAACQLPFGQLPLLQIDGMEIVQSQAAVRYLARRAHIAGNSAQDALKCDMIAEAVRDVLSLVLAFPFRKYSGTPVTGNSPPSSSSGEITKREEFQAHLTATKDKWSFVGKRLEAILKNNLPADHPAVLSTIPATGSVDRGAAATKVASPKLGDAPVHMVGSSLTYADVLVAHVTTWIVEECGKEAVEGMPLLVLLQNQVISMPSMMRFIRSVNYYPPGDAAYVQQVNVTLGRVV